MQPIALPFKLNVRKKRSSRPRWSWLKPETGSWVADTGIRMTLPARLLLMVLLLQLFSGCVSLAYYEGDYHGKVIDAETLQPIEGAVVLGVWSKMYGTAGGPVYKYYDARETLTDENGEFTINGKGPRAMTHLQKMDIVIFKAGYSHLDRSSWEELKTEERIQWNRNKAIISLSKIPLEERKKRLTPYIGGSVPMRKQVLFRKEIKQEYNEVFK